jgi:ribosomal protein S18 acetylase RimI-like enzyme
VSWFRSSRRRGKDTRQTGSAAAQAEQPAPLSPAAAAEREESARELQGRHLAELHEMARLAGIERYRLLRREQLIDMLIASGAAPAAVEERPPQFRIEEVGRASNDLVEAVTRLVGQLSTTAPAPSGRDVEEVVRSPVTRLLVARDEQQQVVGMLTLALFRTPTGPRAWIEDVVVDQRARGRGLGEALTREAVRLATQNGTVRVDLTSAPRRVAANRLYEKLGFRERETRVFRLERD